MDRSRKMVEMALENAKAQTTKAPLKSDLENIESNGQKDKSPLIYLTDSSNESEPNPFEYSSEDYIPESSESESEYDESPRHSSTSEYISTPAYSPITPIRTLPILHPSNDVVNTTPLSRKRKANPEKWRKNSLKKLRNMGKEYLLPSGEMKPAKKMGYGCNNSCRYKCKEAISFEERNQIFNTFYKLADKTRQWNFILENSKEVEKKITRVVSGNSRRSCTREYFLYRINGSTKVSIRVCLTTFIHTLAISHQCVETVYKKYKVGNCILSPDKRGSFVRKINPEMENTIISVKDHINSIPLIESHYLREQTTRKYMDGDLSIAKMHRLYLEWMKEHATSSTPATLRQYRDTFNREFNIGFHIPKKDQCEECHQFSNLNDEQRSEQQFTHNIHLHNKQRARELKNIDKGLDSEKTIVACFDFQKILPVPTADISVFYYKRKLAVYNFTIYNLKTKRATCYVWDETTAKKGANEVISCLYQFIKSEKDNDVNQFIFWSDNCYGQNKNRIVFGGYSWLAKTLEVSISHKFLEKGHTQNEGDSVHSVIERAKKRKTIYTPEQWYSLIRNCGAEKSENYAVVEMTKDKFYNFKAYTIQLNTTKNEQDEKIRWTNIRQVDVLKNDPNILLYKCCFSEPAKKIILFKTNNCRGRKKKFIFPNELLNCNNGPLPISREKLTDLQFLCNNNYIPRIYRPFYEKLSSVIRAVDASDSE